MKRLVIFFSIFCSVLGFAHDAHSFTQKIYVAPEQVQVNHTEILIELEGEIFEVISLSVDSEGLFVICNSVDWVTCPRCNRKFDWHSQSIDCPHKTLIHVKL